MDTIGVTSNDPLRIRKKLETQGIKTVGAKIKEFSGFKNMDFLNTPNVDDFKEDNSIDQDQSNKKEFEYSIPIISDKKDSSEVYFNSILIC